MQCWYLNLPFEFAILESAPLGMLLVSTNHYLLHSATRNSVAIYISNGRDILVLVLLEVGGLLV